MEKIKVDVDNVITKCWQITRDYFGVGNGIFKLQMKQQRFGYSFLSIGHKIGNFYKSLLLRETLGAKEEGNCLSIIHDI